MELKCHSYSTGTETKHLKTKLVVWQFLQPVLQLNVCSMPVAALDSCIWGGDWGANECGEDRQVCHCILYMMQYI